MPWKTDTQENKNGLNVKFPYSTLRHLRKSQERKVRTITGNKTKRYKNRLSVHFSLLPYSCSGFGEPLPYPEPLE